MFVIIPVGALKGGMGSSVLTRPHLFGKCLTIIKPRGAKGAKKEEKAY